MRRKEEISKQGQTNNKAKQHSTPKSVTFPKKNELPLVHDIISHTMIILSLEIFTLENKLLSVSKYSYITVHDIIFYTIIGNLYIGKQAVVSEQVFLYYCP